MFIPTDKKIIKIFMAKQSAYLLVDGNHAGFEWGGGICSNEKTIVILSLLAAPFVVC